METERSFGSLDLRHVLLGSLACLLTINQLVPCDSTSVEMGRNVVATVLAWLLLILLQLPQYQSAGRRPRLGSTLWMFIGLLLIQLASVVVLITTEEGHGRYGINVFWQWTGFAIVFYSILQLARSPSECRALIAIMIALAAASSVFGIYQFSYSIPATLHQYETTSEAGKQQILSEKVGIDGTPGSPARTLYENRLRSTEPFGTFALANSLAGFLTPWIIITVGLLFSSRRQVSSGSKITIALGLTTLILLVAILLTKSRSAYIAVAVGIIAVVYLGFRRRAMSWREVGLSAVAIVLIVVSLIGIGAIDSEVVSEFTKSLTFRLQYWQASMAMIGDNPLLGCGPGNFQQNYPQYKSPTESEVIADPHNFLLEVWATCGTLGALMFIAIFVMFGREVNFRSVQAFPDKPAQDTQKSIVCVYLGTVSGFPLGFAFGAMSGLPLGFEMLIGGILVAALVMCVFHRWVVSGTMPVAVIVVAISGCLINLLAAGGIGFPGVAMSLWCLMAVALNLSGSRRSQLTATKRQWVTVGVVVCAAFAFYVTGYRATMNAGAQIELGKQALRQREPSRAEASFLAAAAADNYAPEPWMILVDVYFRQWMRTQQSRDLQKFNRSIQESLRRNSKSFAMHRHFGDLHLAAYMKLSQQSLLASAIDHYEEMVERYPHHAIMHAQLAWALTLADRNQDAVGEAEMALELDSVCTHAEHRLAVLHLYHGEVGSEYEKLRGRQIAEPIMHRLRKWSDEAEGEKENNSTIPQRLPDED